MTSTSTIPYDPSLVLGMIVEPGKITQLQHIADLQKPVDGARDKFNSLLRQKLSLDMTKRELISLGASDKDIEELQKQIAEIMTATTKAAGELGGAVIKAEQAIAKYKSSEGQTQIGTQLRSPIDFSASQLESLPLSSDSMDMDVQYFRYESNEQKSRSGAKAVSSFVGAKVSSWLGNTYGAQAGASAHQASTQAVDAHGIFGTLVIVANCTSKNVQIFSPMQIDPDPAVESYVFSTGEKMPVEDVPAMKELALAAVQKSDQAKSLPVISGVSYGSSFVGFVHFEQIERTQSSQSAQSKAMQARGEVESDLMFASITGSFGVDAQTSRSVKELLSTSNVQSHCSVIAMGLIPSIKSSQVTTVVKALQGDPKQHMEELAAMQGASNSSVASMAAAGQAAKTGQSMEEMKTDYIKAAVDAVGDLDRTANQVIDLNSMMIALDDYIAKAGEGKIGVPINYYMSYVTKRDIAMAWMKKYYPDELYKKPDNQESGKS